MTDLQKVRKQMRAVLKRIRTVHGIECEPPMAPDKKKKYSWESSTYKLQVGIFFPEYRKVCCWEVLNPSTMEKEDYIRLADDAVQNLYTCVNHEIESGILVKKKN